MLWTQRALEVNRPVSKDVVLDTFKALADPEEEKVDGSVH